MADELESAEQVTEMLFQEALRKKAKVPEKTGFCLVCEEPTPGAFCSPECREDYERLAKLRTIRGN